MNLIGVDVGYAATRPTTGIALWRVGQEVGLAKAGTRWEERRRSLPSGIIFRLAALDAPIMANLDGNPRRGCEQFFYGGRFWNRCRPGLSHHGRSLPLREAGKEAAKGFSEVLNGSCSIAANFLVLSGLAIVEAFPNTFLGVLLPNVAFEDTKPRNEHRSDWLYRKALETKRLELALERLGWDDARTVQCFRRQTDHDLRAALVCLLTAGFAVSCATVIGDVKHGWFWLPPLDIWAAWARAELDKRLHCLHQSGFAATCVVPSAVSKTT